MRRLGTANRTLASLLVVLAGAAPALAGDNNEVLIRQESPLGTWSGNTLSVDQSGASNALFGGINANLTGHLPALALAHLSGQLGIQPLALQRGEGNEATVSMTGNGGELQLFQSTASRTGEGGNNIASLTAANAALGGIIQLGEDNNAALTGDAAQGLIAQIGNGNRGALDVALGAQGSISQLGDLNRASMVVEQSRGAIVQIGDNNDSGNVLVSGGATLSYTQIGQNLSPAGGQGLQLISWPGNMGTVTITQTAF